MQDLSRLQRYSPALIRAIYDQRVPMVRKLLANGADPDHVEPSTGPWGATHWARSGHLKEHTGARHQVTDELTYHKADFGRGTKFPRCGVPRGTVANDMCDWARSPSGTIEAPVGRSGGGKPRGSPHRLWGLWITLSHTAAPARGAPATSRGPAGAGGQYWWETPRRRPGPAAALDRSAVARVRWTMMHHYSMDMWQVHLKDLAVPDREEWAKWFPDEKDSDSAAGSLLEYLRYVVVEVVTDATTVSVVTWMHRIVNSVVDHLHGAHHPTTDPHAWRSWIKESVIVYLHNANVLQGQPGQPELFYSGAFSDPETDTVWVTKKFPIKIHGLDVLDLCTNSCELNDRLQAASVHWLLVSQQGGLHLPIQH